MEQAGTRILNMNECMNECRIWTVSLKLALVSHKDASPCGLSLWPRPCPPRMLLYPRVVTKISSCRVNTTSRRGIKWPGISFGSIFLLFSDKSRRGLLSQQPGKIPGPRLLMTTLISIASFLSLVTKQQSFSGISSEFIVCVCSSGAVSEALFLSGNERVNQAFQNGIPGEHIQVFGNWSSDAYKRYPLPTKLHAAHCMSSALTTILICCIFVFFLNRYHFVGRFGWAKTVF